jgi:hypothetical protein
MPRPRLAILAAATLLAPFGCSGGSSSTTTTTAAPVTSGTAAAATSGTAAQPPSLPATRPNTAQVVARYGEGFLEVDGGRKILHTKGTAYERGVQYGYLVGDEVEGMFHELTNFVASQGVSLAPAVMQMLSPVGARIFRSYFDADALEEIRGIVDGIHMRNPNSIINEDEMVFLNSIVDLGALVDLATLKCSGLAVWGDISRDRKMFQTRCVDLLVGAGIEKHALVVMARPDGGVAYANPGWAGMIGCASGLNAHGVGVSQVWAFSQDKSVGRPWILATRELMITGDEAEDAVRILGSDQRTYGSNFVFADRGDTRGGQPKALAIESSWSHFFVFRDDDPQEDLAVWQGQPYAIRIPYAVFRGDCAMNPLLRSLQTASNGPTGDPRTSSAYQNRYKGQADEILAYVNAGQKIGAAECIEITKKVAMRRSSLQCSVYANSDLDLELWVSNATKINGQISYAFQEPYHQYSLDYYTPTTTLVPDHTRVTLGAPLKVAALVETLGRSRGLDVALTLEAGGQSWPLGSIDALLLPEKGRVTGQTQVTIPAAATLGAARLVAETLEAGTADLVDRSIVELTLTR